ECETFTGASPHLHDMGDDVNGAWMSGIESERAPRNLLGTAILAVLLQAERIHCEDARVAGQRVVPFGQHLGDTGAQHAPPAEAEVERMRDRERDDVARPVDDNGPVTFESKGRIAPQPCTRCGRVTTSRIVQVWGHRLDGGYACRKSGSRGEGVGAHYEG